MHKDISTYNNTQAVPWKDICNQLAIIIDDEPSYTENKLWHGAPVWFIEGNPVVGYSVLKNCVRLLFWSGQSFDESDLVAQGGFKAAEIRYTTAEQIQSGKIKRWLKKSEAIQWDYKNIVKRRGKLIRLH